MDSWCTDGISMDEHRVSVWQKRGILLREKTYLKHKFYFVRMKEMHCEAGGCAEIQAAQGKPASKKKGWNDEYGDFRKDAVRKGREAVQ